MSFNDDEPIVADLPGGAENNGNSFPAGKTTLTVINETEAPLEKTDFMVMVELTGSSVDLVTVLDTADVQDLKLKIAPYLNASAVEKVEAGKYPPTNADDGSVTVNFGDLYLKDVPQVFVDLTLPEVKQRISQDILQISYSYKNSSDGKIFDASPVIVTVTRRGSAPIERPKKESIRLRTAVMIKKACEMANKNNIANAKYNIDMNLRRSINTSASFANKIIHIPRSSNSFVSRPQPLGLRHFPCLALAPPRLPMLSCLPTLAPFR